MAFTKYPKVRRPSHSSTDGLFAAESDPLVITEKLDGNNYRFQRDGDSLRFGSRNVDLGTDPDEIGGMFEDVTEYLLENVDVELLADIEDAFANALGSDAVTLTVFGENAVQHTIDEYDWQRMPQYNVFDVYVSYPEHPNDDGRWLSWDDSGSSVFPLLGRTELPPVATVEEVVASLGLELVPVVEKTSVGGFLDDGGLEEFEVPESTYRLDDGPAEGVVFRNQATGVKAKKISEPFAERHESAKSKNYDDPNDHQKFITNHVTERRIEKNIAKLIESPETDYDELEMELMEDLHLQVWRDVWAEDYEQIIEETWTLDLDNLHNEVANKCASHLRDLIQAGKTPVAVVDPGRGDLLTDPTE